MGGGTIGDAPTAPKAKPRILVPPRGSLFANGSRPGFSPGPASLVSSLFPEQGRFSFSQLLAKAMASPLATAQPQPQLESPGPSFVVPPGLSPTGLLNSPGYFSPLQSSFGMSHQQALAHVTAQAALSQSLKQMQTQFQHSSSKYPLEPSTNHSSQTPENLKLESISESSQSGKNTGDKPASDGYNWRKYGQKHVKASECPRSYYKCTHLNCPVKKKVERSSDGRVSEITYKGEHNHDLPMPNKRGKDSCVLDKTNMASEGWIEIDGLKEVHSESENIQTATEMVSKHYRDISNNHYKEDTAAVVVGKGEDEEPIAKKRSLDIGLSRPASSHEAVSEPKIVLQTRSEVDLLDDGYKWRKYGQKVVKGNPHPRGKAVYMRSPLTPLFAGAVKALGSYYRCTYAGCNVRKHVERASTDPNAVVTTYEGKHNHDIPTGRHSIRSSAQQLKTQKTGSKNRLLHKEIDYGDKRHITMTLQPKEHIVA
ncbi:hypothetical protein OROGR_018272 [Orobanche gracilis]